MSMGIGSAVRLTGRERELLRLYAQGYTSREIADRWGRSIRTVQFHRMNLYQTYGVHSLLRLLQAHYRAQEGKLCC